MGVYQAAAAPPASAAGGAAAAGRARAANQPSAPHVFEGAPSCPRRVRALGPHVLVYFRLTDSVRIVGIVLLSPSVGVLHHKVAYPVIGPFNDNQEVLLYPVSNNV